MSQPSALARFFRRMFEKFTNTFYEGPEPPDRIADMVVFFANAHPHATRAQWVKFASEHARETYRSGWLRGMEHAERDDAEPEVDPDVIADTMDGGEWRRRPVGPMMSNPEDDDWDWLEGGITLEGNERAVVEDYENEERSAMEQMEAMRGDR